MKRARKSASDAARASMLAAFIELDMFSNSIYFVVGVTLLNDRVMGNGRSGSDELRDTRDDEKITARSRSYFMNRLFARSIPRDHTRCRPFEKHDHEAKSGSGLICGVEGSPRSTGISSSPGNRDR